MINNENNNTAQYLNLIKALATNARSNIQNIKEEGLEMISRLFFNVLECTDSEFNEFLIKENIQQ